MFQRDLRRFLAFYELPRIPQKLQEHEHAAGFRETCYRYFRACQELSEMFQSAFRSISWGFRGLRGFQGHFRGFLLFSEDLRGASGYFREFHEVSESLRDMRVTTAA